MTNSFDILGEITLVAIVWSLIFAGVLVVIITMPNGLELASLHQPALDNLKADCYTQGYIDGRASILSEQSNGAYNPEPMGVPDGYESNRTPQWRAYADCIAYDAGCTELSTIRSGSWVASI